LQELCNTYYTELTDIGAFADTDRIQVFYAGKCVLDLKNDFLHDGIPQRQLTAIINGVYNTAQKASQEAPSGLEYLPNLLKLLAHPNIASKAGTIRLYDHEIQGGTVVKPLTGVRDDGPSDAAVIKPAGTGGFRGIVLSNGINTEYGKRDAYKMALAVVDEAIRNAVAVGADPARIAILDNFCWGDPLNPETLGTLVEAVRGCHDAAVRYRAPFISGKDSLNNEYMGADGFRHAIPPTLLISALGMIADVNKSVTMDLKQSGNLVYLIGDFKPSFGGSHFCLVNEAAQAVSNETVPVVSDFSPKVYAALHAAIAGGLVSAVHDISEGGLLVCAAEMCIGGRLGLKLNIKSDDILRSLFAETTGCFLVEVRPEHAAIFRGVFEGLPLREVALVTAKPELKVINNQRSLFAVSLDRLVTAWGATL
jgi:phosphoribosylformylglycinamidine synthase